MNTTESNKKIAEFMGLEYYPKINNFLKNRTLYTLSELKYSTSWDWLMEVVEKIEKTQTPNYYSLDKSTNEDFITSFDLNSDVVIVTILFKQKDSTKQRRTKQFSIPRNNLKLIECVYKAVIAFIDWYNENAAKEN